MKAIRFNGEIGSVSSKRDGSMGLRIATPELSVEEKAAVMEMQGINVDILIAPLDSPPDAPITEVDKDIHSKSQSQRIRAVLYLLWKQGGELEDFNIYYKQRTEKIIEWLKNKLED